MSDPGLDAVAASDPRLAAWRERYGDPPRYALPPGFASLCTIVLEQLVSLASAAASRVRLEALAPLEPEALLALGPDGVRSAGIPSGKARTLVTLAGAVHDRSLDLSAVSALSDAEAIAALTALWGIGPWTAECYLLRALGRPDVLPAGDLALQRAAARLRRLPARPTADELRVLAESWRPHRSSAARLLWHGYLADPAIRSA